MDLKKANIEGKLSDVITLEQLQDYRDLYNTGPVAIEVKREDNGETYILPYRSASQKMDKSGVYPVSVKGGIDLIMYPTKHKSDYQPEVIDFSNNENIREYYNKIDKVRDIERDILTSPDNVFTPHTSESDSPEMRGLKEAIKAKHIDIDKYADRFGENFPNDKRKMKDDKITLFLLKRMCECLDMKAELIISDANPDVPNPIGHSIHIAIAGNVNENI